jgi:hypothetical protein
MLHYLAQWLHLYVIHFGAWMTFAFGVTLYKRGLPSLKELPDMLKTALVISVILSVFSSHSHHYMKNMIPDTKILHEDKGK